MAIYSLSLISNFLILGCVLCLANHVSFTTANEIVVLGKFGGDEPVVKFSPAEREIKLICDLSNVDFTNETTPQWSFYQNGKDVVKDVASSCKKGNSAGPLEDDCEVSFDKDKSQLVLEVDDIAENEFGDYVCHTGTLESINKTFVLRELVHLTRKIRDGNKIKHEISKTVLVGEILPIYCNATGLDKHHKISWLKDGIDITQELNNKMDIFENFTREGDLSFYGPASLEHRGNYTCKVDTTDSETKRFYPIEFSFFIRVKEGNEWRFPLYILLGECAAIGIFTAIINWREKRIEEDDIVIEDSEDEDDDVPKSSKNTNGTQNNNSNGK